VDYGIDYLPHLQYCMVLRKEDTYMTEQELLEMFIQERINMLLVKLSKTKPAKSPEENDRIFQAKFFIKALPDDKRELIENYIEQFTDWLAKEEPFLYQQGFLDGIRVSNRLRTL